MTLFEINKPFPIKAPSQEGPRMELWNDGLVVCIKMPNCTQDEIEAFHTSFDKYSYLETSTTVPIAIWVFDFPKPFGEIDVNFNARIVKPEVVSWYLDISDEVKNLLTFFLLDGQILKGIKAFGLHLEAVTLFNNTIRKQLELNYREGDYIRYLNSIFNFSTRELFNMGAKFKK